MYLQTTDSRVCIGISLEFSEFPKMLSLHNKKVPNTLAIEKHYASLFEAPLTDFSVVESFIKDVCKWGNYAGVGGKVLKNNDSSKILEAFKKAISALSSTESDLASALSAINSLYGLGTPSFASKHLRFIKPQECPVYDRILSDALPYSFNPDGYVRFAQDCKNISKQLGEMGIKNPVREDGSWYVSDVEAALFSYLFLKK